MCLCRNQWRSCGRQSSSSGGTNDLATKLHLCPHRHDGKTHNLKIIRPSIHVSVMHVMTTFLHSCPLQVWSITYHSWLTFVLLLWSCLIWMLRARQRFAALCSPFILLYGLALCCLQYVWAMDLETELPQHIGTMSLRQLGLDRAHYPCLRLGAMVRTLKLWQMYFLPLSYNTGT